MIDENFDDDNNKNEDDSRFGHKIIVECCANKPCEYTDDDDVEDDHQVHFVSYNGPTTSKHATKKLMLPIVNNPCDSTFDDNKNVKCCNKFKLIFNKCLLDELSNDLLLLKNELNQKNKNELKNYLKNNKYVLNTKLGLIYFHGKSFSWTQDYSLNDIRSVLKGKKKLTSMQKGALLSAAFNINKCIENIDIFINYIYNRGYRLIKKNKAYSVKFTNKSIKKDFLLNLNENFELVDLFEDTVKLLNLDVLRDRLKSAYKTSGTYLDIFDLRYQLSKRKIIDKSHCKECLAIKNGDDDDELLKHIFSKANNDDYLILNKNIHSKVRYMKEVESHVYQIPIDKNSKLAKFIQNFSINIENITEYDLLYHKIKNPDGNNGADKYSNEQLFRKILIANSVVECKFDVNNLFINFINSLNDLNGAELKLEEIIDEISRYLYNELIVLSDFAFNCSNHSLSTAKLELNYSTKPWIYGMIKRPHDKVAVKKPSIQYAFNTRFINHESLASIKQILFSRNHLDIFGLQINAINANDSLESEIKSAYNKMLKLIFDNETDVKLGDELQIDPKSIEFNGRGIVKLAYTKLNDAYITLTDPVKRDIYVNNLKSLTKYRSMLQ